ncbi:MAG: hypothetical protein ACI9LO_002863 [Planctomycetota bacterium]|jgi:hypothetical protein
MAGLFMILLRLTSGVDYTNESAVVSAFNLELNLALGLREQSVVLATTYVVSRMKFGAALAYQNIAGDYDFAAKLLHAEPFGFRIASVAGTACRFLMCHIVMP